MGRKRSGWNAEISAQIDEFIQERKISENKMADEFKARPTNDVVQKHAHRLNEEVREQVVERVYEEILRLGTEDHVLTLENGRSWRAGGKS